MSDTITMYGTATCTNCARSKRLLDSMGVAYDYIDLDADEKAADTALAVSGRTSTPLIVFPDGTHVVEPSDADLRAKVEALLDEKRGSVSQARPERLGSTRGRGSVSTGSTREAA